MFPIINNITDVLYAIKDRKEFSVKDKDEFIIIDYNIVLSDTFYDDTLDSNILNLRRECRGLTFDAKTGDIVARKYHKFHNVNENLYCQYYDIDISKPHIILDKLDGSLINIVKQHGEYHLHTKNGYTDTAIKAEFEIDFTKHIKLVETLGKHYTALFEYVSPNNLIVVQYNTPKLILTAIRHNMTGEYMLYNDMVDIANKHGVDVVGCLNVQNKSMGELVEYISNIVADIEGFVIRFNDGNMYKLKTNDYILLHKSRENCLYEKNIWKLLLSNTIDDFKKLLCEDDLKNVIEFEQSFNNELMYLVDKISNFIKQSKAEIQYNDDKEYKKKLAMEYIKNFDIVKLRSFILSNCDKEQDILDRLKQYLLMYHSSSQTKIDDIRHVLRNVKYKPMLFSEQLEG